MLWLLVFMGGYYLLSRVILIVDDLVRTGSNPSAANIAGHWSGGLPPNFYYACPLVGDVIFLYTLNAWAGLLLTKAVVGTASKLKAWQAARVSKRLDNMCRALRPTEALEFRAAEDEVEAALHNFSLRAVRRQR